MSTPESTCWTVIRAAAAGSLADREELARRYLGVVRAYLSARWHGSHLRHDLDDVVQEVFVECFRQGGKVNETLNKVTALREQARTVSAGSAALFAQAREQAQRALALVESGPADDTLKNLVRQLREELDEEEKDRTLVAALDEARLAQAETLGENQFAVERAVPRFREAFRDYGLAAGEGEPKAAAERIRQLGFDGQWLEVAVNNPG